MEFEHKKTREPFFIRKPKKNPLIRESERGKIFCTDYFDLREKVCGENGEVLKTFFGDDATRKIGKATYEYCRDKSCKINYHILGIMLNSVNVEGDNRPLRILIRYPYSENRINHVLVTDKKYSESEDLTRNFKLSLIDYRLLS